MGLVNSWHTELVIGILLNDEKELETKLDLLTEISLITKNDETFRICEKFRDLLCSQEVVGKRESNLSCDDAGQDDSENTGTEEFNEINGDE